MGPITTSTECTTSLVGLGADCLRVAEWLMKAHEIQPDTAVSLSNEVLYRNGFRLDP